VHADSTEALPAKSASPGFAQSALSHPPSQFPPFYSWRGVFGVGCVAFGKKHFDLSLTVR
jgi:hypothetical protein